MKRLFAIVLAAAMIVACASLCACGTNLGEVYDGTPYINSVDDFDDMTGAYNTYIAPGAVAGALIIAGAIAVIVVFAKRRKAAK